MKDKTKLIKMSVADYLALQIEASGKQQQQIAAESGFEKPNMIAMIKTGKVKVPMARVQALAKSLGVDPIAFWSMCMREYQPENWAALESIFSQPVLTANELSVVRALREHNLTTKSLAPEQVEGIASAIANALPKES